MTQGKISFALGSLSFAGEGDEKWLAEQLDKVIQAVPTLRAAAAASGGTDGGEAGNDDEASGGGGASATVGTLPAHLKKHAPGNSQVKKFLATADWLRLKGETALTSGKVAKALSDAHQARLANPADCLNKNVSKGFCEKKADNTFFITPEGVKDLGHP